MIYGRACMKILDIEPIKDDGVTSCYDAQLQSLGKWFQIGYECMYLDNWKFVFGPEGMKGQGIWERGNLAPRLYFDDQLRTEELYSYYHGIKLTKCPINKENIDGILHTQLELGYPIILCMW